MYAVLILDIVTFIILSLAAYVVWKEKTRFQSLRTFIPALIILVISRLCDILIEHPNFPLSRIFRLPEGTIELVLTTLGNVLDVISFTLIIYGFVKIIEFSKASEQHIQNLEYLLPLCAHCKMYRSEEGTWHPIEKYLAESGTPNMTHGICPDCLAKYYGSTSSITRSAE